MSDQKWYYVVDRFEGDIAVLVGDDRSRHDVPRTALPEGCQEGAVLIVPLVAGAPEWSRAVIDEPERQRRLAKAKAALGRLKRRDPGGDVTL